MARRVRSAIIETREARRRLERRSAPHWVRLEEGLHLGYRRLSQGGTWVMRFYLGKGVRHAYRGKDTERHYRKQVIGEADDYSDADGVKVLTYDQAQAKCRDLKKSRVLSGAGVMDGPYTVRQAMDDYIQFLESSGRQHHSAKVRADALVLPDLGDIEVAILTSDRVRSWHAKLAKTPARVRTKKGKPQKHRNEPMTDEVQRRRRTTANRTLTILRAALNHAFNEHRIANNAAWRRVKPFRGVESARLRYLSIEEARRLINASEGDFRDLVRAALHTGCRFGELAQLTAADFNGDSGTLNIHRSKTGKGRHVVLTDEGQKFFRTLCMGRSGGESMFRRSWNKTATQRDMRDALGRAKITPAISFHGLRHTYASHAVMRGVPLLVLARNLGHVDGRMVEKHYGHLAPSYITDAIRAGAPTYGTVEEGNVTDIGDARREG
jgi:integrase